MTPRAARILRRLLMTLGVFCCGIAACLTYFSVRLIHDGIYPPDGNGSLGHVGMVIAGGIAGFLTLICAMLGVWLLRKGKKLANSPSGGA